MMIYTVKLLMLNPLSNSIEKVLCLAVAVGNVDMEEDVLVNQIMMAANFLVSLLKRTGKMLVPWLLNLPWVHHSESTKFIDLYIYI